MPNVILGDLAGRSALLDNVATRGEVVNVVLIMVEEVSRLFLRDSEEESRKVSVPSEG